MRLFLIALLFALPLNTASAQDAKKTFDALKKLEGVWHGPMRTDPAAKGVDGTATTVTLRVTSMGNLLMHEMTGVGRPDNPITTIYLDNDRIALTHYCDAGNRPRMVAKASDDGKSVEFDFVDVAGSTKYGYMRRAVFTFVDENTHVEEWTFMTPADKPVRASVTLKRAAAAPVVKAAAVHKHGE